MTDGIKSNLEPIEEGDLNLKEKFTGGGKVENVLAKKNEETFPTPEKMERKEGVVEKEAAYAKILSKFPAQSQKVQTDDDVIADANSANTGIDAESKIGNLIKIAENKGIPHAVKVARHMEDNYILDEFHDRMLAEELHDALVTKGMIKEI